MTTPRITDAERAALPVARAAIEGRASSYGPADAIVFALSRAQMLRTVAEAAQLDSLLQELAAAGAAVASGNEERGHLAARVAELQPYEELHPQECPTGQHLGWFVIADGPLPCPWCRIAELEGAPETPGRRRRMWVPAVTSTGRHARRRTAAEADAIAAEARGDRSGAALIRSRQEAIDAEQTARAGGVL